MTDDEKVAYIKKLWNLPTRSSPPPDLLVAVRLKHLLLFSSYAFETSSLLRGWGLACDDQTMVHEADRQARELRCELVALLPD